MTPHDLAHWFPPARIRAIGPRIELRLPTDDELLTLIDVALDGIHDPQYMPFASPWTDAAPDALARNLLSWHWSQRSAHSAESWNLLLVAFVDGEPVGAQDLGATDFGVVRTVLTGSWIGQRFQGSGLGTEMRDVVLALAFDGLGAAHAQSGAYVDNAASLRVSEKVGYRPNGSRWVQRTRGELAPGGASSEAVEEARFTIDAAAWRARSNRPDVRIEGVDADVRSYLGA